MGRKYVTGARSGFMRGVPVSAAVPLLALVVFASCSATTKPPPEALTNPLDAGGEGTDATAPAGGADSSTTTPPVDAGEPVDQGSEAPADATDEPEASSVTPAGCVATDPDATDVKPMMCGTQCVNVDTDPKNCGGCSQPCNLAGQICDFGMCACPAGQSVCSGQCVDLNNDATNCGSCAHNCQGDPCATGVCQPRVIATVQVSPHNMQNFAIAVDSSTVYWTEGNPSGSGSVFWKEVAAMMTPNFLGSTTDPRGIVADLNYVYWVDYSDGSVNRGNVIGGSSVSPLLGPDVSDSGMEPGSLALVVDAQHVYWVDSAWGNVNMISKNPGGTVTPLAQGRSTPRAIAVDATYVYWVDYGSVANTGSVNKIPIDPANGTQAISLATAEDQPYSIAVDGTSVYWTNRTSPNGTVKSVPLGGGTIQTLAQGQANPDGIAIDSQYVYWTNLNGNTVMKAPLAGGAPYTIASGQNNPTQIAVDSNSVFWANYGDGTVMKVAK